MTKKRAISLIEKVDELFKSLFPDGWIDSLEWSDEEKSRKSFFLGKGKISDAESKLFVLFSNLVMQGDHLRFPTDGIDSLLDKCTYEIVETGDNKQKNSLQNDYQQLLIELKSAIMLTKFYIYITSEIYEKRVSRKRILNFIEVDKPSSKRDSWLTLLDTIIDIWLFEYRFHTIKEKSETFLFAKSIWKKQKVIL